MNKKRSALYPAAACLLLCLFLGYTISAIGPFALDAHIQNYVLGIRSHDLTTLMVGITMLAGPLMLFVLSAVVLMVLSTQRRIHDMLVFIITMLCGAVFHVVIKIIIEISRPADGLITASGWSYPSGHTTMAAVAFLMAAILFKDRIHDRTKRDLYFFFFAAVVLLVAFSRVYLGVHWFSDILGGLFLGTGIVYLGVYLMQHPKTLK